jgi:hypothetical protein
MIRLDDVKPGFNETVHQKSQNTMTFRCVSQDPLYPHWPGMNTYNEYNQKAADCRWKIALNFF